MFIFQYFLVKRLLITISWYAFVLTVKGKETEWKRNIIVVLEDKIQLEERTKQEYDFCKFANFVQIIEAYSQKMKMETSLLFLFVFVVINLWVKVGRDSSFLLFNHVFSCKLHVDRTFSQVKKAPKINVSICYFSFHVYPFFVCPFPPQLVIGDFIFKKSVSLKF